MIQAALHGKSGPLEGMEDVLTSAVFGRLRYIEPCQGILPFLQSAICYDSKTTLGDYFRALGQELALYSDVSYFFWPRHSVCGEPDLVLILRSHSEGAMDLLLLVECKLQSDKSGVGDNDQLKRYYVAVNKDIKNFIREEIRSFGGDVGPIIYLTSKEAVCEIEESIRQLVKEGNELRHPIFHLRWQTLHKLFSERGDEHDHAKRLIFDDVASYLKAMNLAEYSGISTPPYAILAIASEAPPVFYTSNGGSGISSCFFKTLPVLDLDLNEVCFLGGRK